MKAFRIASLAIVGTAVSILYYALGAGDKACTSKRGRVLVSPGIGPVAKKKGEAKMIRGSPIGARPAFHNPLLGIARSTP